MERLLLAVLPALLVLAAVALLVVLGLGAGGNPHAFAGRCDLCHLSDPEPGEPGLFVLDVDSLCNGCHLMPEKNSHPSRILPNQPVPEDFPLDWQGRITCATCHDPHADDFQDNPDLLRTEARGRSFCLLCHETLFGDGLPHAGVGGMAHAKSSTPPDRETLSRLLDPVSLECLECHDGLIAPDAGYRLPGAESLTYRERMLSHPIGVDYREASLRRRNLKPMEALPPLIALYEGKVGCGSCHNPYSNEPSMLVFSDRRSALCLGCHDK